ncbi:TIGD4 [Cordylochernes scorpioides]|uniref:TIGD4 n=1 Tax=Cordylochernes scorpioides TaxID=51811 RepID=A0ABY6LIC1_9ARAC|nr:TIGD4 [Cordylochernes scorpioides]
MNMAPALQSLVENRQRVSSDTMYFAAEETTQRNASHQDVEDELLKWFKKSRQNNIPVSGALVKEKAKEISVSLGVENFKCSDGWLWRFQRRNTIASLVVSGEINKVSEETVTDWLTKFEEIKNEYKDEDIFNIDETGVFYNLLPDRSLDFYGTKCHGTSKSKERLMVVLCCNATGSEISKLWIIGKYKNPRCLNKINRLILPFDYTHQKSAWVDAYSFRFWLTKFQCKMAAENRHVLLTMDNCSAHDTKDLDLPNVRIVYFPANCTSRIQPLDQEIIAAFKCHFKSRLVKNALLGIESEQTTVKWNILQAMSAMAASWDSVSSQTIKNCFKKAWPTVEGKTADSFSLPETMLDEPEEWTKLLSATNPAETLTFLEYVALDEGLEICGSPELEEKKKEETEDDEVKEEIMMPTRGEVIAALETLQKLSKTSADIDIHFEDDLDKIRRECLKQCPIKYHQKTITDFLKPAEKTQI